MKALLQKVCGTGLRVMNSISFTAPLLARLVVGFIFLQTGWGKLHNLEGVATFFTSLGIPAPYAQAVFISGLEFFGGIALIVGLFTRPISALLGATMVVALLTADRESFINALQGKDDKTLLDVAPVALGMFLLYFLCSGPGWLSFDYLLRKWVGVDDESPPMADRAVAKTVIMK